MPSAGCFLLHVKLSFKLESLFIYLFLICKDEFRKWSLRKIKEVKNSSFSFTTLKIFCESQIQIACKQGNESITATHRGQPRTCWAPLHGSVLHARIFPSVGMPLKVTLGDWEVSYPWQILRTVTNSILSNLSQVIEWIDCTQNPLDINCWPRWLRWDTAASRLPLRRIMESKEVHSEPCD